MKTIKIKCLKDDTLEVIEIQYNGDFKRFLLDLWASQGKSDWYEIMED